MPSVFILKMESMGFYQGYPPVIFCRADFEGDGMAGFFKAGEIPQVRKLPALLRLHGLHGAILAFKKNALAVWFFQQRQTSVIMAQAGEPLDEIVLAQALERREPRDFLIGQAHLPRPAAAGRAALAFEENWHRIGWLMRP